PRSASVQLQAARVVMPPRCTLSPYFRAVLLRGAPASLLTPPRRELVTLAAAACSRWRRFHVFSQAASPRAALPSRPHARAGCRRPGSAEDADRLLRRSELPLGEGEGDPAESPLGEAGTC